MRDSLPRGRKWGIQKGSMPYTVGFVDPSQWRLISAFDTCRAEASKFKSGGRPEAPAAIWRRSEMHVRLVRFQNIIQE